MSRRSGSVFRWGQNLNWYKNHTNVPGFWSLAANLRIPGLRIYARAWFRAMAADSDFPEISPAYTERRIEVDYSVGLRNVAWRVAWHYGDAK